MAVPHCTAFPLVDTHCHLDDPILAVRREKVLNAAAVAGVRRYVVPGVSPDCWGRIAATVSGNPHLFAAFGVHPMCAAVWSDDVREQLAACLQQAVAVGEIGLDYRCSQPRELQAQVFRQQVRLAVAADLPVLIHCRDAFRDLLAIMAEERVGRVGGIMHAFSGSPEIARECTRMGLLISVAGPVTFANAVRPVRVVERVPLSSLVLETDAPDLAPEPCRGMVNEPSFLPHIAHAVARIKRVPYGEVANMTTLNAEHLLKI